MLPTFVFSAMLDVTCRPLLWRVCLLIRFGQVSVYAADDMQNRTSFLLTFLVIMAATACAQPSAISHTGQPQTTSATAVPKPQDTEVWTPVPRVVTPGANCGAPPSDAIILFDGKNLDQWVSAKDNSPAKWIVAGGVVTVNKAAGDIETRRAFRNFQLHIEWKVPQNITGSGQARGNSGVFLAATGPDSGYELQILDSYHNSTYVNGQAGSIYKQGIPLVNPNRKPGEWQTYDVVWTAPTFKADGSLKTPAYVTVFFNGVLVQNHFELKGETRYIGQPFYKKFDRAPILLQAHGDPSESISFRNIWVRELK
jgi:3-keto-disaccharide hydrolase